MPVIFFAIQKPSLYLSFSHNYKVRRFSFGYGFSYSKNSWMLEYNDRFNPPPPKRQPVTKSNDAIGLIFSSYFQAGKSFNLGLIYRPTLMKFHSSRPFQYEQLISIDFVWKLYWYSWGGFLALRMAATLPDKLEACLAISPMINQLASEHLSLQWMQQQAVKNRNRKAVAELSKVKVPFENAEQDLLSPKLAREVYWKSIRAARVWWALGV